MSLTSWARRRGRWGHRLAPVARVRTAIAAAADAVVIAVDPRRLVCQELVHVIRIARIEPVFDVKLGNAHRRKGR